MESEGKELLDLVEAASGGASKAAFRAGREAGLRAALAVAREHVCGKSLLDAIEELLKEAEAE